MPRKSNNDADTQRLMAIFAPRLKAVRRALGLTQKTVAKSVGVTQDFYRCIENGHSFPSVENLVRIAEALNVSVDHLFGIENQGPSLAHSTVSDPEQITYIVEKLRDDPDQTRFVIQLLAYCQRLERDHDHDPEAIAESTDERDSLDIDPARWDLALAIWPRHLVDAAAEQPVDDIRTYRAFWLRVDQELLQDMLVGDTGLRYLVNYLDFTQPAEHRRIIIQLFLGMHRKARRALEPSVLGALLDHGDHTVRAALHSRLQKGDPHLLDRLRRAMERSYTPRNGRQVFDAAHHREEEAWTPLVTVLLDPLISPVRILDALRVGIMHHLDRGIRQGTIEAKSFKRDGLDLDTKFTDSHETVLVRAYRLLEIGY